MTFILRALCVFALALCMTALPKAAEAQPAFSKAFSPNTIGPGGSSTLTFTITNGSGSPVTDLAFTNILPTVPGDVDIANPANASTSCPGGVVSAPAGGGTISFSDGRVGAGSSCTVTVDVTASTPGTHTNPAVTLTSSAGSSMSLPVDLTVVTTLPSFSKSFSPSTVTLGGRSTLTFLIDNSANANRIGNLDFTDTLPGGIAVASPANASTNCISASAPDTVLTAVPGSNQIDLDASGSTFFPGFEVLPAGATCTVTVDVVGTAIGVQNNSVGLLADFTSAGNAVAALTVTGAGAGNLQITKSFTDDPAAPGGDVTLEFTLQNRDRSSAATNVAFTDDLDAMLSGAAVQSLLSNTCGGSVTGTGLLNVSGGSIAAEGSCTIRVSVSVPGGAAAGSYPNTTSAITGTIGGSAVTGNQATDSLFVSSGVPLGFTTSFTPGSIASGGSTTLEYTISNPNTGAGATDITFDNLLTPPLPFPVNVILPPSPNPPCGAGSSLAFYFPDTNQQGLRLTGGNLAASDSCTFSVTLTIPSGTAGGTFFNSTDTLSATINGATVNSPGASDMLVINGGVNLDFTKSFPDSPANAGGTTTLEFTIRNIEGGPVSGLSFTDDLDAMLTGTTAAGLPISACGGTLSGSAGDTFLTFTGGSLATGASCTISATLNIPGGAATGDYVNTSSALTGAGGVRDDAASATLSVLGATGQPLVFTKAFIDNPHLPGQAGTLRYTIENPNVTGDATSIGFNENLTSTLSGLEATGTPTANTCGGSPSVPIPSFFSFSGGALVAGGTCVIDLPIMVPIGAANDSYQSQSGALSSSLGFSGVATAQLVVETARLEFAKAFTDDPVTAGDNATLEFTLTNPTAQAVSDLAFSDDLDAMLSGATFASAVANTCGGMATTAPGASTFAYDGGTLGASSSCIVRIAVATPGSATTGSYANETSALTGTTGGLTVTGPIARDNLQVVVAGAPGFTKAFAGPVFAGQTVNLVFTIDNSGNATLASDLAFSDDLDAMLTGAAATGGSSTCGGTVSGTGLVTFSGGTVAAGASCTVTVPVQVPGSAAAGSYPNTSSQLFAGGLPLSAAATASLTVEPAPGFAKAFAPTSVNQGGTSTLTFTIDNSASALAASNLAFTDNFPAGMAVASPAGAATTCSGGTLTAVSGSGTASYSGGTVGAGASCTVQVDVVANGAGALANTSGDLTSVAGNSGTASATLTSLAQADLSVSVTDAPDPVFPLQNLVYTIEVSNAGPSPSQNVQSTFTLPAGVTFVSSSGCAEDPNGAPTCSLGTIASGSSASYTVTGQNTVTSGNLMASASVTSATTADPNAGNNSASATTTVEPQSDISVTKTDGVTSVRAGDTLSYTMVVRNAGPSSDGSVSFTDTFPSDLSCTYTSVAAGGATGNTAAGSGNISETLNMPSASTVTYTATCTVAAGATGTLSNTATATGSNDDPAPGNNSATDNDTVVIEPSLGFTKLFGPDAIVQGGLSTLTFTIDNSANALPANTMAFTDTFPTGLEVANPANVTNSCGGSVAGNPGDTSVSLSGGALAIGATCTIAVDVRAVAAGPLVNTSGPLTSSLPQAAGASDTLAVTAAGAPLFTKLFGPDMVEQGEVSTLTFTIDNSANLIEATTMAFTDTFPAGLEVATPANLNNACGGSVTAASGANTVSLAGGTVAAGAVCTIAVDVRAVGTGVLDNISSDLTSSLGTSTRAQDQITVNAAGAPLFAKAFTPASVNQGEVSTLIFTIDNSANAIEAETLAFTDTFPTGLEVADPANLNTTCGGSFSGAAGDVSVSLSGGTVAAGAVCTIEVDVRALAAASVTNTSSDLTSTLPTATAASATLTISSAAAPGFTKSFTPDVVDQGQVSTMRFVIDNGVNAIEAANLAFTDAFPAGLQVASPANLNHDCGGTVTAAEGDAALSLTGGLVAANASCQIEVDIRSLVAGDVTNTTSVLTSTLPQAPEASATLTVNAASGPGFAKGFAPAVIAHGETTTLIFTIDNGANTIEATDLSFTDTFPAGLWVATPPAVTSSCGGTLNASPRDTSIAFSGGQVAQNASCTVEVAVQAITSGAKTNTSSELSSSLGSSPAATATLTVNTEPLTVTMSFAPAAIEQQQVSTLVYTLANTAEIGATSVSLSDDLPNGLTVSDPSAVATSCPMGNVAINETLTTVSFTGGAVARNTTCTVRVPVTSAIVGTYDNSTERLTSTLGTSAPATATLVVEQATTGSLIIIQNTDTDGAYVFSSQTSVLNFTINTAGGIGRQGPVTVPIGTHVLRQATPDGVGNTAITCSDEDSTGQPRERTLTVNIGRLETVTCVFTSISSRQKTVDTINRFLTKRADLILSSEPSNSRRIDRLKRGSGGASPLSFANGDLNSFLPFTAQISTASESYQISTSFLQMRQAAASLALAHGDQNGIRHIENYRWDAWFEAQYKKFDAGDDTGHFAIAYFGADYLITPDILVGALFQVDDMEDNNAALSTSVDGTGWMAGPYMTARLAPNLYFDGRIAAGQSTNDISPFNTYTDEFTTDRWMAMAGLTGDFQRGNWSIQPGASLSYFEEKQATYVDSIGVVIPSQVVSLGQVKIGPTFTGQFQTLEGVNYSPYFSLDAIYNFGDTKGVTVTNPDTAVTDGWRGRVQAGVDFQMKDGSSLSLSGSYDGIGRGSLEVWGLSFELTIPFQKAVAQ